MGEPFLPASGPRRVAYESLSPAGQDLYRQWWTDPELVSQELSGHPEAPALRTALGFDNEDATPYGVPAGATVDPRLMADMVDWFRWLTPGNEPGNNDDVLERETWFFAREDACEDAATAVRTLTPGVPGPLIIPADLPRRDGVVIWARPIGGTASLIGEDGEEVVLSAALAAVRWVTTTAGLVIEPYFGGPPSVMLIPTGPPGDMAGGADASTYAADCDGAVVADAVPLLHRSVLAEFPMTPYGGISPRMVRTPRRYADGRVMLLLRDRPFLWPWAHPWRTHRRGEATVHDPFSPRLPRLTSTAVHVPTEAALVAVAQRAPLVVPTWVADALAALVATWRQTMLPGRAGLSRPQQRRLPRERLDDMSQDLGGIRIAVLGDRSEGTQSAQAPPRRHVVRGHWSQQWHSGLESHRVIWIESHPRGGRRGDPAGRGRRTVHVIPGAAATTP